MEWGEGGGGGGGGRGTAGIPKPLCCRFSSVCAKCKQGIDTEDDAEGENEDRGPSFFYIYIFSLTLRWGSDSNVVVGKSCSVVCRTDREAGSMSVTPLFL